MAVTKTHPIKSTVGKSISYILDEKKTDGKLLVSSYACSYETADIEFKITREKAPSIRGSHIARHLIQSFEPNEITPDQAHEIGKRLAEEVLGGRYEYVLTTHTDRGHIHNHIIFNTTSFVDYKKYHSNKRSYRFIRETSDMLCEEYGLSVIVPSGEKGKSYAEYQAEKNDTSRKAQLKAVIDMNIAVAKDIDEFLALMEQNGYAVKRQNKNISFRISGGERYIRSKTLGADYTVEAIISRIAGEPRKARAPKQNKRISLIIDIQNSIKAQESKGYEHWAKINNLKQASKTLNYLTEHNITTYEELERLHKEAHTEFESTSVHIKDIEREINHTAVIIKNIDIYSRLKPVYESFKKAKDKRNFAEEHRAEILLYEKAYKELKALNFPPIKKLRGEYADLTEIKKELYSEYRQQRSKTKEIDTIKQNVDSILGASHRLSREKSALSQE